MKKGYTPKGLEHDGIRDIEELKILICYVFERVNTPMNLDDILDVLLLTDIANYFEYVTAYNDLVKRENLILDKENDNKYVLSHSGCLIANCLNDKVQKTTRDKVAGIALMLDKRKKVKKVHNVTINSTKNGYYVSCNIKGEEETNLFSFTVFAPTYDEAVSIENNFLDNPLLVYEVMIATVTRNKTFIKNALNEHIDNEH